MGKWDLDEREVFAKTVWAEARGESDEGQRAVAHVIMNRANPSRGQWPNSVKGVCLQDWQFECWNGKNDIDVSSEWGAYDNIKRMTDNVYAGTSSDPSGGADHYNNPDKEQATWLGGVNVVKRMGNHVFYKQK